MTCATVRGLDHGNRRRRGEAAAEIVRSPVCCAGRPAQSRITPAEWSCACTACRTRVDQGGPAGRALPVYGGGRTRRARPRLDPAARHAADLQACRMAALGGGGWWARPARRAPSRDAMRWPCMAGCQSLAGRATTLAPTAAGACRTAVWPRPCRLRACWRQSHFRQPAWPAPSAPRRETSTHFVLPRYDLTHAQIARGQDGLAIP